MTPELEERVAELLFHTSQDMAAEETESGFIRIFWNEAGAQDREAWIRLARAAIEATGVKELVEALMPFAREAEEWSDDVPNAVFPEIVAVDGSRGLARFSVGHLRTARSTLSRIQGETR